MRRQTPMNYRVRIILVAALLALLVPGAAMAAEFTLAPAQPAVADGQIHAAYPSGAQANRDGRVDINWTAPRDALTGTWVITIQGLKSNVARGVPFEIR